MTTFQRIAEIETPGTVYLGDKEMAELRADPAYLDLVKAWPAEEKFDKMKVNQCFIFWNRDHASLFDFRPEQGATALARAERLARLFHDVYEALAPDHGYRTREASAKPWEEVPEQNRKLMIATAGRILSDGWTAPDVVEKMRREQSRVLELYFDTGKAVGLQPDDNFEDGPKRARALAQMVRKWETLAVDRALMLAQGDTPEEEIDIPGGEVKNRPGWNDLLDFAAEQLYDARKGFEQAADGGMFAEKCGKAAQALLEIKVMLDNPMKTIRAIAKDRDLWQMKSGAIEEKLAYTEAALGQSQDAVVDLAKGHDRLIKLLERHARLSESTPAEAHQLYLDVTALLNSGEVKAIDV